MFHSGGDNFVGSNLQKSIPVMSCAQIDNVSDTTISDGKNMIDGVQNKSDNGVTDDTKADSVFDDLVLMTGIPNMKLLQTSVSEVHINSFVAALVQDAHCTDKTDDNWAGRTPLTIGRLPKQTVLTYALSDSDSHI